MTLRSPGRPRSARHGRWPGQSPKHQLRSASGRIFEWEFKVDSLARKFQPQAKLSYNDPSLVLQAVLDGQGTAQMPGCLICDSLSRESPLLAEFCRRLGRPLLASCHGLADI